MVVTGGIPQSGGLVLVGMAGIFFALVFPKPEKVWFLLALYLDLLLLENQQVIEVQPPFCLIIKGKRGVTSFLPDYQEKAR